MIGNDVSDVDETGERTPAEWLKTPRFHGWHLIDREGWKDGTWEQLISIDEFQRRLSECTINVDVGAAMGTQAAGLKLSSASGRHYGQEVAEQVDTHREVQYLADLVTAAANKLNMLLELAAQNGIDADIEIVDVTEVSHPAARKLLSITLKNGAR